MSNPISRSEASKAKWADPVIRQRIIAGQRQYWRDHPEAREQRGETVKEALASSEVRQRISDGTKKGLANPAVRQKISETSKRAWRGNTQRREQARETATEIFSDPEVERKRREAHATPETSKAISEGNARSWAKDPDRKQRTSKQFKALWAERKAKQSEAERILALKAITGRPAIRKEICTEALKLHEDGTTSWSQAAIRLLPEQCRKKGAQAIGENLRKAVDYWRRHENQKSRS
jgi:hypothetical protein